MAFLPGFEHDIFISYAHDNNPGGEDGAGGWVTQFHRRLYSELRQLVGPELKIWRDIKMERNQVFNETIKSAVENSAIFVAINSFSYEKSDYCPKEVEWFCNEANASGWRLKIGDRHRIFNLLLNNIPHDRWHDAFKGRTGYSFYQTRAGKNVGLPADLNGEVFKDQLTELAIDLYTTLEAFKEAIEKIPPPAAPAPSQNGKNRAPAFDAGLTVFLAETADPLRDARRRLATHLLENGINTIELSQDTPPPEEKVVAAIRKARLCVHLFDAWPGRPVAGSQTESHPQRHVELARQTGKPRLIWAPPWLDLESVEDKTHREFLLRLRDGDRDAGDYNFVRESFSNLAQVILGKLDEISKAAVAYRPSGAVLLDAHLKDDDHVIELRNLLRARNITTYINQNEDDPRQNVEILERRLRQVSQMVIVFGNVKEDWVQGRLGEALRITGTEKFPLTCGIYFTSERRKGSDGGQIKLGALTIYKFDASDLNNSQSRIPLFAGI